MTATLTPEAWLTLCERQLARAMHGNQAAARWCALHAPANDVAQLWRDYQRLLRGYQRLHLLYRGASKLQAGWWTDGCAEHKAWGIEVQKQWQDPQHQQDMREMLERVDFAAMSENDKTDMMEGLTEYILATLRAHGVPSGKLNDQQAKRLWEAFTSHKLVETVRAVKAEIEARELAGKEQANGHAD